MTAVRIPAALVRRPVIKKSWRSRSDPQCHRVYRMERDFIGWSVTTTHSRAYLTSVARHVCASWGVAECPIRISAKPKDRVYGRCYEDYIWLNASGDKPGNNLGTLIHELAHWVTDRKYGDELPHHGKEFAYVYGRLLDKYKLLPFACFKLLCRKYKVGVLSNT